jgi:hypothetical protein
MLPTSRPRTPRQIQQTTNTNRNLGMRAPSNSLPPRKRAGRSGKRHWFQITGLPGWKRAQLGIPAFGNARCTPPVESATSKLQPDVHPPDLP